MNSGRTKSTVADSAIPTSTSFREGTAQDAIDFVHTEAAKILAGFIAMGAIVIKD